MKRYVELLLNWFYKNKRKTNLLKNMWKFTNEPGFLTYDDIKEKFKNSILFKTIPTVFMSFLDSIKTK